MNHVIDLKPGVELVKKFTVSKEHTASFLGSGSVAVLSTPSMIMMMENTARLAVEDKLPEGYTTVGIHVDVYHLKAAPLGAEIEVRVKLVAVEGKKLKFEVVAYWEEKKIGEGLHERYVVDKKRFLEKAKQH